MWGLGFLGDVFRDWLRKWWPYIGIALLFVAGVTYGLLAEDKAQAYEVIRMGTQLLWIALAIFAVGIVVSALRTKPPQ